MCVMPDKSCEEAVRDDSGGLECAVVGQLPLEHPDLPLGAEANFELGDLPLLRVAKKSRERHGIARVPGVRQKSSAAQKHEQKQDPQDDGLVDPLQQHERTIRTKRAESLVLSGGK